MELKEEFLAAYALVAADKQAKAALNNAKSIIQAAKDAGVTHIHDPARITHYTGKHYSVPLVAISTPHYKLIEADLSADMKLSINKTAQCYSDGPAFPTQHCSAIVAALEAKNIAWKACYVSKKAFGLMPPSPNHQN